MKKVEKLDVYQMVTDRIIEEMQKGIIPWHKPWTCSPESDAINYVTRKAYSPLNQMLLGKAGEYLTFAQVKALKGSIKKGAKSSIVVFFTTQSRSKTKIENEEGEEVEVTTVREYQFPVLKYYRVFHIDDCTGIESKLEKPEPKEVELSPIEAAEQVITNYLDREPSLTFKNDAPSSQAYYSLNRDEVVLPMLAQYDTVEEYYSTAFHEFTHSTGHADRCNRQLGSIARFGSEKYSREELVAEIGSAMICSQLGISNESVFKNSVAYLQSWIKALKNDNKMIVWAASRAEKAAKYIIGENK